MNRQCGPIQNGGFFSINSISTKDHWSIFYDSNSSRLHTIRIIIDVKERKLIRVSVNVYDHTVNVEPADVLNRTQSKNHCGDFNHMIMA